MRLLLAITLLLVAIPIHAQWVRQKVDTTASFRGLAVINEKIVWASGTGGTVIRTIDGGKTWNVITVPGAEKLDFRDIEAFDANTAYILSIGNGDSSRIYKTTDGGKTWKPQFKNDDPKKFFDAIACRNSEHCIAMSDPVDGHFPLIVTYDGESWERFPGEVPVAVQGEAAFAASGTCLIVLAKQFNEEDLIKNGRIFLVTGGMATRVFVGGKNLTWQAHESPIQKGAAAKGIFSIAMFDAKNGVVVGGDYEKSDENFKNLAFTRDGGTTWALGAGLTGYRSGVSYIDRNTIIAVGTNGSDITRNNGKTWTVAGKENLNAVQSKGRRATWAVGPKGIVAKLK